MAAFLHKRNKINKLKYCQESKKQVVYAYLITMWVSEIWRNEVSCHIIWNTARRASSDGVRRWYRCN